MTATTRTTTLFVTLTAATLALFVLDLATGAVRLSVSQVWAALTGSGGAADAATVTIVRHIRLVKALVALVAGAALAVSGLEMQTIFRNPLAGPYVLGISSGASLGVALFVLGTPLLSGTAATLLADAGMAGAAWCGAAAVLALVLAASHRIHDIMALLILGMMLSSGVSAVVQILQYLSREEQLKNFVVWTMGSLGDVTASQLWLLFAAAAAGLSLAVLAVKPLNILLLGEDYARSMGLHIRRARTMVFASTVLLAGSVTAFCGPVGFIGLAMPHVARIAFARADHRVLLPASALTGSAVLLVCDIVSKQLTLPVNAITSLVGIPIVVWIVLRHRSVMF